MFYLFSGDDYYPNGGANDFIGSFSTIEEAKESLFYVRDWWHLTDDFMNIVESGRGYDV